MDIFVFFILLAASFAAAVTGMLFPTGDWYKTLNKPSWVPPNWAFPIVWTSIYVLIAFAGSRVAGLTGSGYAMAFWGLQITLNTLWTPVFFGLRRLRGALPIMGVLWLAVLGCLITHIQLDLIAGLAFVPYLIWLTIAAALNYSVATLNPDQQPLEIHKL